MWPYFFSLLHQPPSSTLAALHGSLTLMMARKAKSTDDQMTKGQKKGKDQEALTVSSVQMECTCVPNITDVKMRKSRASKHNRIRRITVVGGEKELHSGKIQHDKALNILDKIRDNVMQYLLE